MLKYFLEALRLSILAKLHNKDPDLKDFVEIVRKENCR